MAILDACLKPRAITGTQNLLTTIGHQHDLALQYPDKFILCCVPMPLARPSARSEALEIDSELRKPRGVSECKTYAVTAWRIKGGRVIGANSTWGRRHINSFQCLSPFQGVYGGTL